MMLSLPSSTHIISAMAVMGLVMEAIQNIASGRIGSFVFRSEVPMVSSASTLSGDETMSTAPEIV